VPTARSATVTTAEWSCSEASGEGEGEGQGEGQGEGTRSGDGDGSGTGEAEAPPGKHWRQPWQLPQWQSSNQERVRCFQGGF